MWSFTRVPVILDVLGDALVVIVDALLQAALVGQMDAERAENTTNAQAAVAAMLEGHAAIPYYLFWTQGNPRVRFLARGFRTSRVAPVPLKRRGHSAPSGRYLPCLVLQPHGTARRNVAAANVTSQVVLLVNLDDEFVGVVFLVCLARVVIVCGVKRPRDVFAVAGLRE